MIKVVYDLHSLNISTRQHGATPLLVKGLLVVLKSIGKWPLSSPVNILVNSFPVSFWAQSLGLFVSYPDTKKMTANIVEASQPHFTKQRLIPQWLPPSFMNMAM